MCGMVSDIAEREGIQLPDFSPQAVDTLRTQILPRSPRRRTPRPYGYSVVDLELADKVQDVVFNDPGLDVVVMTSALPQSQDEVSPFLDGALRRIADRVKAARAQVMLAAPLMTDYGAFAASTAKLSGCR